MYNDLDLSHFSVQGKDLNDPNAFNNQNQNRQMMLAKLLSRKNEEDDGKTEYVNGFAVKKSGLDGLSSALGGLTQYYMMNGGKLGG